jgi:hypothetical protein
VWREGNPEIVADHLTALNDKSVIPVFIKRKNRFLQFSPCRNETASSKFSFPPPFKETTMKSVTRIVLPIVLSLTAAAAMASEFTPEAPFVSTMSRAEVRAEAIAARDAGQIANGEFAPVIVAESTSTLTRAQVRAEAVEAQRLGLLTAGESTVLPTPAQMEQVRLAGLRAVQANNLAQSQNQRVTN